MTAPASPPSAAPLAEPEGAPDDAPLTADKAATDRGEWQILHELSPFLRPFLGRILFALALVVAGKLAGLAVPAVLKRLVDTLDADVANPVLVLPVALLLAYGASRIGMTLFTEVRQIVFARVMARVSRRVTLQVFRHLHALSLRFHLARRTGGVARDIERGGSAISDLLDWMIYTILPTLFEIALVTAVLVWMYDWSYAVITLLTLVAYAGYTFLVTEWRTRYYRAAVEADTRANERAVDSLLNYETVKYFGNEEHEAQRYDRSLQHREEAQVMSRKTLGLLNLGQAAIVSIGVTAMMWRAAAGVVDGSMTLGGLVFVNAVLLQLSAPLNLLGMMYREVKQAFTNLERLFGLLDQTLDVRDRENALPLRASRPRVRFEDVRFGYDPRREILSGVDFEVPAGGTVAVVGHSGSGKSTLARLLYRFYDVDGGRIAIEAAARAAHIHERILGFPDGYETEVGERGLKLSGGEKQRVAIARALLKNPAILIFDEATSALDSQSEKAIQAELERIAQGRTTIVIAHRLSTVMNADQILVMDQGRIVERGTHAELLAHGGRFATMWAMQLQENAG
jgi:ATP-binding cassette subfamily B protein